MPQFILRSRSPGYNHYYIPKVSFNLQEQSDFNEKGKVYLNKSSYFKKGSGIIIPREFYLKVLEEIMKRRTKG